MPRGLIVALLGIVIAVATDQFSAQIPLAWRPNPLVLGLLIVASIIAGVLIERWPHRHTPIDTTRQAVIAKVRTTWIRGLLDQSLYHESRLALGLDVRLDKVELHLRREVQELDQKPQPPVCDGLLLVNVTPYRKCSDLG